MTGMAVVQMSSDVNHVPPTASVIINSTEAVHHVYFINLV